MLDIDTEWASFITKDTNIVDDNDEPVEYTDVESIKPNDFIPKCNDIYISTQTKIAYLNQPIDLNEVFWKMPVIGYHEEREGIIKKQMKMNNVTQKEVDVMEEKIDACTDYIDVDIISKVDNPTGRRTQFKDVRKINIGICKKDLTSYRIKKKGAFYNCFVLILRIKDSEDSFKESHVKVFNTGKLEIPGIKTDKYLLIVLKNLIELLSPHISTDVHVIHEKTETVLINSNFTSNFFIDRHILSEILKFQYNIHVVYDPCSYPGIQCKFYYNSKREIQDGVCYCKTKCGKTKYNKTIEKHSCSEVSFMIFRTGSVLIVGHCTEAILHIIYRFVKEILIKECENIYIEGSAIIKPKSKKIWKKNIYVDT